MYLKAARVLNDSIILSMYYYNYSTALSLKSSISEREKFITLNIIDDLYRPVGRGGEEEGDGKLRTIKSSKADSGTECV